MLLQLWVPDVWKYSGSLWAHLLRLTGLGMWIIFVKSRTPTQTGNGQEWIPSQATDMFLQICSNMYECEQLREMGLLKLCFKHLLAIYVFFFFFLMVNLVIISCLCVSYILALCKMLCVLDWDHIYKPLFPPPVFYIKCNSPGTYCSDCTLKLPIFFSSSSFQMHSPGKRFP